MQEKGKHPFDEAKEVKDQNYQHIHHIKQDPKHHYEGYEHPEQYSYPQHYHPSQNYKNKFYFAEKRCVITGASSGIGRAVATWLLNEGAYVALTGRDIDSLESIGSQFPHQSIVIQCDLGVDIQQYDMCTTMIEKLGGDKHRGLDILINCAGVIFDGDCVGTFPQDYDYCMDINLRSCYHITQMLLPFIEKEHGCIVNISSLFGNRPQTGCISYCMSKAGLEMLTKCVALEVASSGVRVNAVAPGTTYTNFMRYAGLTETEFNAWEKRVKPRIPMQKIATPEEIAKVVIFLCSEKAKKITGQILRCDGGRHLTSSGYMPWKGQYLMNRRFESSGSKYSTIIKQKIVDYFTPKPSYGSTKWIQNAQVSNWGTKLEDAHLKVAQNYTKLAPEDDKLKYYEVADDLEQEYIMEHMHKQAEAHHPQHYEKHNI